MDRPLVFEPYLRAMVWGGRRLGAELGKHLPTQDPYGESWELSDHPQHQSRVKGGPHNGMTIEGLIRERGKEILGASKGSPRSFPWLIKFLDARDWLSVQVHPDDDAVKKLWPGEGGKTEAWFVIDAAPESRIYAGLLPGVNEEQFRRALKEHRVPEYLYSFRPKPGDCLFLPAGTVHAVGGGVLMAEVQQTSDATFRLYDWDRKDTEGRSRPLHIDEGLACINWQRGPVTPVKTRHFAESLTADKKYVGQELVKCAYFNLDYHAGREPFPIGGRNCMEAIIVVKGKGFIDAPGGRDWLETGQTRLVPASMPMAWCNPQPEIGFLSASLP